MRKLFLCLLFIPALANAQLDRVKTDMTEQEFMKAVPEAKRDYDAESAWVKDSADAVGVHGGVQWRFYRDTIVAYHFTSQPASGPSEKFPGVDSSGVHHMKASADAIRKGFEITHGKPEKLWNVALTDPNPMDNAVVYLAQWNDNDNRIIRITIIARGADNNSINAPVISSVPRLPTYEMNIVVTMPAQDTYLRYGIGQSAATFFLSNSHLLDQAKFRNNRIYTISDTSISSNAHWKFIFVKDQLATMEYSAYLGTEYGKKKDDEAFTAARIITNDIFSQAKKTFGKNDTLSNRMPDKYKDHARAVEYNEIWFYGGWLPKNGYAVLQFLEIGGGKNPATTFAITFYYEKRSR